MVRKPNGSFDEGVCIAELVALLGFPSREFWQRTPASSLFWDTYGKWTDLVSIPDRYFEDLAGEIKGEDVECFLRWIRLALQWDPEDRPTGMELLLDPWLMEGLSIEPK
ncbi:hypothetical protein N7462_008080 [Penicillium macrosclerotiorum]|uniref:uncharacterized protein n=1 Tax=Penicillium macrosclerotiorum TaxID=303699 RepID=UPI002547F15E|nr:uncharacterized protein N7462_008080 [Penicillium macrosclerotiorum]KAJ5679836.1 hypothetical protein N7462_008080 [Penicillium macrosclerotiorum]